MHSRPAIRAVAVLLGTLVVLGAVVAIAITWLVPVAGAPGDSVSRLGWLMPVVVAALVGALGWVTLANGRVDEDAPRAMIQCVTCGSSVMRGWRMCPHCGHLAEDGESND